MTEKLGVRSGKRPVVSLGASTLSLEEITGLALENLTQRVEHVKGKAPALTSLKITNGGLPGAGASCQLSLTQATAFAPLAQLQNESHEKQTST